MAIDLTGLTAAVAEAETVDASAAALIDGFAAQVTAAVTAALEADANADQASIDAANAAIEEVRSRLAASTGSLAAAITRNTPSQPA